MQNAALSRKALVLASSEPACG